MRVYSFFVISALAAALTFGASSKRLGPEPSESQMQSSFNQFFSKLESVPSSKIQFAAFKKHSCKPFTATRHYCSFTYSAELPVEELSILPSRATFSGMFFVDDDGQLRFEMVIG